MKKDPALGDLINLFLHLGLTQPDLGQRHERPREAPAHGGFMETIGPDFLSCHSRPRDRPSRTRSPGASPGLNSPSFGLYRAIPS